MLPHVEDAPKRVPPFVFVQRQSSLGHSCFVIRHSFAEGPEPVERVLRRLIHF